MMNAEARAKGISLPSGFAFHVERLSSGLKTQKTPCKRACRPTPNSGDAPDARAFEQEIRQKLIESRAVDVIVVVGLNMLPETQ